MVSDKEMPAESIRLLQEYLLMLLAYATSSSLVLLSDFSDEGLELPQTKSVRRGRGPMIDCRAEQTGHWMGDE